MPFWHADKAQQAIKSIANTPVDAAVLIRGALFHAVRKPGTLMRINFATAAFWTYSISSGANGPMTLSSSFSPTLASGSAVESLSPEPCGARQTS